MNFIEEKEDLRVHIEREVVDPLIDPAKNHFGVNEAIHTLREILRREPAQIDE